MRWICLAGFLAMGAVGLGAQAPAHDDWANRKPILSLPFMDVETQIGAATQAATDPFETCSNVDIPGPHLTNTVWYSYTTGPASEYVRFSTRGSTYDTTVAFYVGSPGAFQEVAEGCNDDGAAVSGSAELLGLRLAPLTEYSILVGKWGGPGGGTLQVQAARPPVYTVTKLEDTADGVCDADCSLREAVSAHNGNPGVVVVPAGTFALTLTGTPDDGNARGDLDILRGGALYGAGRALTVIDGNGIDRVLNYRSTATTAETAVLADVTLTHGQAQTGGAIALTQYANAVLLRTTIRDSQAAQGGGIHSFWRVHILDSLIQDCIAQEGGGVYVGDEGGPVLAFFAGSTLASNLARSTGGGGVLRSRSALTTTTVSGNSASDGGGLWLADRRAVLSGVSVVANSAARGGGLMLSSTPLHRIDNSIFALNSATVAGAGADCSALPGKLVGGHNLFESLGLCSFVAPTIANLYGADARVSPVLALNGGLTPTHALLPGSPAIDSGAPGCGAYLGTGYQGGLSVDQRGRSRTIDGNGDGSGVCDRGAYERSRVKGDLDRDRSTDLLLRSEVSNAHVAWLMNGTERLQEAAIQPDPSFGWRVVGMDDFDGDDSDDLVLRDLASGAVEVWRMGGENGAERQGPALPLQNAPDLGLDWTLAATADLNRDGRADLVWRNDITQKIAVWLMAGVERIGTLTPTPDQAVNSNWAIVAALDWNRDGATDLLWYNSTTGKIVQWLLNDQAVRFEGRFTTPPSAGNNNWKVAAGGDYGIGPNGQFGTADVVWRNDTSGRLVVWHLDQNGTRTAGLFTTPDAPLSPLDWRVAGPR